MPHDKNGRKLSAGDRVRIPVRPVKTFIGEPNPAVPDEVPGRFEVVGDEVEYLEGTIAEMFEGEEACNANFTVPGGTWPSTFNTRLVELIEPDPEA